MQGHVSRKWPIHGTYVSIVFVLCKWEEAVVCWCVGVCVCVVLQFRQQPSHSEAPFTLFLPPPLPLPFPCFSLLPLVVPFLAPAPPTPSRTSSHIPHIPHIHGERLEEGRRRRGVRSVEARGDRSRFSRDWGLTLRKGVGASVCVVLASKSGEQKRGWKLNCR